VNAYRSEAQRKVAHGVIIGFLLEILPVLNTLVVNLLKQKFLALKNHAGFMRYFKNSSWMLGEQMLRMVAGLLVGIWVARYLGPEQFGIFSYVLAFTALFSSIAKLGLDGIMVRELVNHADRQDVYLGTAFWMKVLGAFLVMALIAVVLPWTSNDSTTTLYIFIIASGLVFQSFEVVDFYFQSQVLAKFVSICKVIQLTLSSLLKIYLVLTGAELIWFVWVILFDQITLAVTLFFAYRYQKVKILPLAQFDFLVAKRLLKDSWPLMLSGIFVIIYMRTDQIMIKEMLGEYEVGIYSAAVRLSEVWYFIPALITSSLFPAIINAKKVSEALYLQRLQQLYILMVWIAISIAIPMTFLSEWLVVFLYGEIFRSAGEILSIHIWAGVFLFLLVASGKWYINENFSFLALQRNIFAATVNITLNYFLIKITGINGAAIATLISLIASAYLFDLLKRKTHPQFILKTNSFFYPAIKAFAFISNNQGK
jgi:O-antigen/teichoic acid export membrane protein